MTDKEKLRPLYFELQGLLSEAPEEEPGKVGSAFWVISNILTHYNDLVENLVCFTGDSNYSRFIIGKKMFIHPSTGVNFVV